MQRFHPHTALIAILALALPLGSCQHTPGGQSAEDPPSGQAALVEQAPPVTSLGLWDLAQESNDTVAFRSEVLRRFKALGGRRSYEGIAEFVTQCRVHGQATWGSGILDDVRPVLLLQSISAGRYIQPTKELAKSLRLEAGLELDRAYALAERGQWSQLAKLSATAGSVLDPALVDRAPELEPHQTFLSVLVDYAALEVPGAGTAAALEALALRLEPARAQLMALDAPAAQFLASVAHAQLLERRGRMDEAAEVWLQVVDTQAWLEAPEPLRNAIAARITSYSQRLRDSLAVQLEEERRAEIAELHQRYARELERLRRDYAGFESWVRDSDAAVRARLDELKREDEALWRELTEGRVLEASATEDVRLGLGVAADVLSLFGGARALRALARRV
jgi:hypothetical protein